MYILLTCGIYVLFFILFLTHIAQDKNQEVNFAFSCFRWFYYIAFVITVLYTSHIGGGTKELVETFGTTCMFMVLGVIMLFSMAAGGGSSSGSRNSSSSEDSGSVEYVPQRLGGTGWLNVGGGFSNLNSAISSVEHSKKYHPEDAHRVAEKRNGKIVGTAYSC